MDGGFEAYLGNFEDAGCFDTIKAELLDVPMINCFISASDATRA
jgi:hypothetical protein